MAEIILLVGGIMKKSPEQELFMTYKKRIIWPLSIVECKNEKEFKQAFEKHQQKTQLWIMLDETGENLTSQAFSSFLQSSLENYQKVGFIIGIDTGIPKEIKALVRHAISFGKATWPHLIARILLIEQLYRAQQILNNHPYHKI
jgi:23S rRNA (pseudouridine1915-N3)-methyltransferase